MNLQKALPSAAVIVATLACGVVIIQVTELEGGTANLAGIAALIAAGLLAGALFGENVYSGIKGLAIVAEIFIGFLITLLILVAAETREEIENSESAEAVAGTFAFILLIVVILIMIALAILLMILALVVAIGGWIGVKIHSKFVQQPSSTGRYRRPSRRSG